MAEDDGVRFTEISAVHAADGCDGIMVPKFMYITSRARLRILGYCVKCGVGMTVEYELIELEKICPAPGDENSRWVLKIPTKPKLPSLADFEPPPGSKPQ